MIATRLTATDFEIGPILRQLRPDIFGDAAGRLSAVATLDVPARDPRAARGVVRLEPVRLEMAGERWDAQGPIVIRREPGRLTVERLEIAGRLGTATATGWLDDAGTLDGTLRGQVPLALLAVLRHEVREASGKLDLDVRFGRDPREADRSWGAARSPAAWSRFATCRSWSATWKAGWCSRRRGFASRS